MKQLISQGFEIMSADEALKYEYFADWNILKGGANSDAQATGYVMVTPEGFEYLMRKISSSGKQKMGGGLLDNTPKISKEMDNVI